MKISHYPLPYNLLKDNVYEVEADYTIHYHIIIFVKRQYFLINLLNWVIINHRFFFFFNSMSDEIGSNNTTL